MRKTIIFLLLSLLPALLLAKDSSEQINFLESPLFTSLIGGIIGGFLGVIGTLWTSYYGPKKLIEYKESVLEKKLNGPRKQLLKKLLNDSKFPDGRTLETLSIVTGTHPKECRRLLIEISARGIKLKNNKEGWVLIKNKPINEE